MAFLFLSLPSLPLYSVLSGTTKVRRQYRAKHIGTVVHKKGGGSRVSTNGKFGNRQSNHPVCACLTEYDVAAEISDT